MESRTINILNCYTEVIRNKMNDIIEEIQGDFTDWCELGTMLMYRLVKENHPEFKNEIALGKYKNNNHFWNIINDTIVDTTIDQFGRIKVGVINSKWLKNYTIEKFYNWSEFDLLEMTESVYDFISVNY